MAKQLSFKSRVKVPLAQPSNYSAQAAKSSKPLGRTHLNFYQSSEDFAWLLMSSASTARRRPVLKLGVNDEEKVAPFGTVSGSKNGPLPLGNLFANTIT